MCRPLRFQVLVWGGRGEGEDGVGRVKGGGGGGVYSDDDDFTVHVPLGGVGGTLAVELEEDEGDDVREQAEEGGEEGDRVQARVERLRGDVHRHGGGREDEAHQGARWGEREDGMGGGRMGSWIDRDIVSHTGVGGGVLQGMTSRCGGAYISTWM